MQLTTFVAGALAATAGLAAAQCNGQPCDPKAHVKLYQGGGCTQFVQETFFFSSFSQPPDACRAVPSGFDVVSVNTTDVSPGYTVHYYTDAACSQGETDAPPNHCEQASTPFKSAKFFVLQK